MKLGQQIRIKDGKGTVGVIYELGASTLKVDVITKTGIGRLTLRYDQVEEI